MILLSRLDGEEIALNADLIECLEAKPGTIVTLVDGRSYLVAEGLQEVVSRVRMFKAGALAARDSLGSPGRNRRP